VARMDAADYWHTSAASSRALAYQDGRSDEYQARVRLPHWGWPSHAGQAINPAMARWTPEDLPSKQVLFHHGECSIGVFRG